MEVKELINEANDAINNKKGFSPLAIVQLMILIVVVTWFLSNIYEQVRLTKEATDSMVKTIKEEKQENDAFRINIRADIADLRTRQAVTDQEIKELKDKNNH